MSQLHFDKSRDLLSFLKILSEESVKEARGSLDNQQEDIIAGIKGDMKTYGVTKEADGQSELPPVVIQTAPPAPSSDDKETDSTDSNSAGDTDKQPEVEVEVVEEIEEFNPDEPVSVESVRDGINDLRQGFSVNDDEVKPQLSSYLESLDTVELETLGVFLRALSGILLKKMTADTAPDPSDVLKVQYTKKDQVKKPSVEKIKKKSPTSSGKPSEDTTPPEMSATPIQVGAPQQMSEIRKRVRNLMMK